MSDAREPGYYWVRWWPDSEWTVMEYFGGEWWSTGNEQGSRSGPEIIGPRIEPPAPPEAP